MLKATSTFLYMLQRLCINVWHSQSYDSIAAACVHMWT